MPEKQNILDRVLTPDDIKKLPASDIPELCGSIRNFLVDKVTASGGHLASNLGAVELTVAMLRVFSPPEDRIIFDVGHQSYVYKMFTGRREGFDELRKPGGLSGFTKRSESEFDAFGAGHSSTSLSAALGFAKADRIFGRDSYTVAVIGDGAYTGGMIHEALNNVEKDLRLIIILNENEMSISKNIGAFAKYIAKVRSSKKYIKVKRGTTRVIRHIPLIGKPLFELVKNIKIRIKNRLYGSNYFEDLGLFYVGPGDGNDYAVVESMLRAAASQNQSAIIHLKTKKGKGYPPAEDNPNEYHCIRPEMNSENEKNFSRAFGEILTDIAEEHPEVCAVTAAMESGTGLCGFRDRFPARFFDEGIAEDHALTFSAGLAAAGCRPFIPVYSSFLQRGYDSLLHDIALQSLPVVVCVDRAGLNSSDGPTHHGIFDVSFLSAIPGFEIYAPADFSYLRRILTSSLKASGPVAVRYPNSPEYLDFSGFREIDPENTLPALTDAPESGAAGVLIVTYGKISAEAVGAAEKLRESGTECSVAVIQTLKPFDIPLSEIRSLHSGGTGTLVFVEEGIKNGGSSMILAEKLKESSRPVTEGVRTLILAVDDSFVSPPSRVDSLLDYAGLSSGRIAERIEIFLKEC